MKLNLAEKSAIRLAAREELARRSYEAYFQLANPGMKLYPHVKYITDKLQKIVDGEQHFYIFEMPPQHGKSLTITKTFPSYYLMKNPDKRAMIVTYSQDLYSQFATSNRRAFNLWSKRLYGLETRKNTAQTFDIANHRGSFYATSITGGATGMSADLLIIDDPVKNAEEAKSPTVKQKIWDEWKNTFSTRLQNGASVVVIMTRWQTDDLAGRLLQKMSFPWEEVKLPAIAEDIPRGQTDPIGRHNGEALCPELHSLEDLKTQKLNLGTQSFTALYQQKPTVEGGNIFKREWIKYYVPDRATMLRLGLTEKDVDILPHHLDEQVQAWDATFKSGENDDFVAGQTWARRGANLYLRPGWCHKRLSFTETLSAIKEQSRMYPRALAKLVEDKANGPAIIDTLKIKLPGVIAVSPGSDSKESRARSVSPVFEAGQIHVPHPLWHPEVEDVIEEWCGFPNMAHDDNVDSMVYAVKKLVRRKRGIIRSVKF